MRLQKLFHRLGMLSFGLLGVLLLLLAGEGLARLFYVPGDLAQKVIDPFCHRIFRPGLQNSFQITNDQDEWVHVAVNELGMRGPSMSVAGTPGLNVFFLGGSTTENYRFNLQDSFPEIIGRALEQGLGVPVRAYNAGMSANTTSHSLSRLVHQALPYRPDVVVVYHEINDFLSGFAPEYDPSGRYLPIPLERHLPRSFLWHWLRFGCTPSDFRTARPYAPFTRLESPSSRYTWTMPEGFPALLRFRQNLISMAALAQAHSFRLLLLTQGHLYGAPLPEQEKAEHFILLGRFSKLGLGAPDDESLGRGMEAFRQEVLQTPQSPWVRVLDLAADLPRDWSCFYDECHLTKLGNRKIAESITPELLEWLREARPTPPPTSRGSF